jgi:hypothetical protein
MLAKLSSICATRFGFYKAVIVPAELHIVGGPMRPAPVLSRLTELELALAVTTELATELMTEASCVAQGGSVYLTASRRRQWYTWRPIGAGRDPQRHILAAGVED